MGDNLWSIAGSSEVLNYDPLLWSLVYSNNQSIIDDADLIQPRVNITDKTRKNLEQQDKASKHVKSRGNWSIGTRKASDESYLRSK